MKSYITEHQDGIIVVMTEAEISSAYDDAAEYDGFVDFIVLGEVCEDGK